VLLLCESIVDSPDDPIVKAPLHAFIVVSPILKINHIDELLFLYLMLS